MSKFYLNKISVYFSYNQFKYLKYILLHLFKFVFISFLLNVNKVLKHIRNIITKIVLSINIYKLNFFFKFIRLSILFFSLRTLKIITLLFLLSSLLDNLLISPSYARLEEIQKDWLCTDFGNRNCLFEDGYGCAIPNFNYNFGCVDKDKVVNGNKCFITKNEQSNESHDSDKSLPVIEINNKSYVLSKINSSQKICKYDSNEMLCRNEDAQMIETSSSPEAGKIYTSGSEIKGLVTEVLNAKEVLDVSGGKCGLMKDKSSCLKTCSSKKEKKKVKVKDEQGKEKEIEIEESECDRLVTGGNWQEWYECSKGSEGSSYCKGGGYSEEYFKGSDKKQYLDKSCCAENNEYVKYDYNTYYKLDNTFNIGDYVMFEGVCVKKSDLHKLNKVDVYRYLVLGRKSSDSNENSLFVQDNGSNSWWGHASAIARHYLYFSEGSPVVYDYSNSSVYKVIYTFPNKLEEFIKKYASCTERAIIDGRSECVDPGFWALKDRRCINNQSSQQCFLKQLDTCLVNKHSKQRYCSLNSNSSCDVCIKWGIDIKEFSLEGFKNAKFECMEYHTANWNDDIFMRLYDSIPNSWTDTKTPGSPYVPNTREGVVKYKGRAGASWGANIELREDKKCEYGRVCKNKSSSEGIDISDFKIGYYLEKYYNDRNWWHRDEILDADEAWITKKCSDQDWFKCRDGDTYECPNYEYQMWNDRYVFEVSGVSCNDGNYYWSSGSEQYCGSTNGPGYCLTRGYKCPEKSFDCKYHSQSRSISWMEPEFSIREVDIEEVYDPNLIVE